MIDPVTQYALDVHEGRRVAGVPERLAAQRHLHDLSRAGQLDDDLARRVDAHQVGVRARPAFDPNFAWRWDAEQAQFVAIEWFTYLRHVKGPLAGKPIELIPAHVFDIGCIFGWVARENSVQWANGRQTGVRRFTKAFLTEARKNAKTTRLAGCGLYLMVGDMEESPDVYCAAVDRTQARVLYNSSMAMAKKSPDIRARLDIGKYSMSHKTRGGEMTAFSGETKNKDAFNPSGAFVDEYHAHATSEIYDLLASSFGQRAQALLAVITTAGMSVESPCYQEYQYCKMILNDPAKNDRYFVMIRELDEKDDEHDPANWIKSNPLRAATAEGLALLQEQHDEAFGSGNGAKIRTFRVKNLNRWVEGNENTYMGEHMERYDKLAVSRDEFIALTRGKLCLNGLDLSKTVDLTADGFVFLLDDGRVAVCAHGFLPEDAMDSHEKTDRIPYRAWARDGWLTVNDGAVIDYTNFQNHIDDCESLYEWNIHQLCYDPYNASHLINEQTAKGYTCVKIDQTMKVLSEPTKKFRELVLQGMLVHDGSPLLRWCVANAVQIADTKENIMLSKKRAKDTKRIDLLAAIINALRMLEALRAASDYVKHIKSDEFSY
jgi:phage terminase large subunit-like protein